MQKMRNAIGKRMNDVASEVRAINLRVRSTAFLIFPVRDFEESEVSNGKPSCYTRINHGSTYPSNTIRPDKCFLGLHKGVMQPFCAGVKPRLEANTAVFSSCCFCWPRSLLLLLLLLFLLGLFCCYQIFKVLKLSHFSTDRTCN